MNFIGSFYYRYLALGFSVIPIKTLAYASIKVPGPDCDAKRPIVKWEPYQSRFATPDEIDNWAARWPSAGIAVVCGLISDLLVLDDDALARPPLAAWGRTPQQEQDYKDLLEVYTHAQLVNLYAASDELHNELMKLPSARAKSSRGRHFYFRLPRNDDGTLMDIGKRRGFLPKWDLQARGSYIIVPPSIHPSGTAYVWESPPEDGICQCPPGILNSILQIKAQFEAVPGVGKTTTWRGPEAIPQGMRDDQMTRWIGKQMRGRTFYQELSWPELLEQATLRDFRYNKPPMGDAEVIKCFNSIAAKERARRNTDASALNQTYEPDSDPEVAVAKELGIMNLHAPDYAVNGFILDGTTQLFGKPKSGKSFMALQIALAVATGKPLFEPSIAMMAHANHPQGYGTHRGDVLYLALEDSKLRIQERVKALYGSAHEKDWPANLEFAIHWSPLYDKGLVHIEQWLDTHPNARLIVIDTLAAFVGGGQPDKGSVFRAEYRMFRPIWELGQRRKVPILVVDHASKGKGKMGSADPFDSGAGTLGSQAAVDTVMVMEHDEKGPYARISFKGRDIERGHIDIEHGSKSPLWKIRTTFEEKK